MPDDEPARTETLFLIVSMVLMLLVMCLTAYFAFSYCRYHSVPGRDLGPSRPRESIGIGGFELFVRDVGATRSGTPLLVVHGGPGHSSLSFRASLDPLAREHRVLYYDQRGSGLSELKADRSLYTVEALVQEIEQIRRDVLKADRMAILAHSAGGAIAQHYAAAHPERIDRLVLVASTTANNNMSSGRLWRSLGPGLYAAALGLPPRDPERADDWFTTTQVDEDRKRLFDPDRSHLLVDSGPSRFTTWFAVSQSLAGRDLSEQLLRVTAPVLVVYGDADDAHTGAKAARRIGRSFPAGRLAAIASSGHWPFLENADEFLATVSSFLAEEAQPR